MLDPFLFYLTGSRSNKKSANANPLLARLSFIYFEHVFPINHPKLHLFIPFRYVNNILVDDNSSTSDIYNRVVNVHNKVFNLDITYDNDYSCNHYLDMEMKVSNNGITTKLYN